GRPDRDEQAGGRGEQRAPVLRFRQLAYKEREDRDRRKDGVAALAPGLRKVDVGVPEQRRERAGAFDVPWRGTRERSTNLHREEPRAEDFDRERRRNIDREVERRELEECVEAQMALDVERLETEEELETSAE